MARRAAARGKPFTYELTAEEWDRQQALKPKAPLPDWQTKRKLAYFVYFIGADEGPIKIGMSHDPEARLATFQMGCPVALKLLAVTKGYFDVEDAYHQRFAEHRLHGEWFERHADILAEIERLS